MIVMKFGGTSVGSAKRIRDAANLILKSQKKHDVVVVVSAMSGVTDLLVAAAHAAAQKSTAKQSKNLKLIQERYLEALPGLKLSPQAEAATKAIIDDKISDLKQLLTSIAVLGELTPRALDTILSFGERMNIHLVATAIDNAGGRAAPLEASDFILTDSRFGNARPNLNKSKRRTKSAITPLLKKKIIPVVTGYIGANKNGVITTLGRGGSDYSATIIGSCLDAGAIWIWTDVDGVMTADPKMVKGARTIAGLNYNEAAELSYFGAKVLHPSTMIPAALKNIPIFIKNTFKPDLAGTKISGKTRKNGSSSKAIATIGSLSLITVQGKGMLGVPGVAARVFSAIASKGTNVLFISQASSEYNISFVIKHEDGQRAVKTLQDEFKMELAAKTIETVKIEEKLAIVAVVGEGMRGHPGIAGEIFSALGAVKINIRAIAQGSSERNISFVINEKEVPKAVKSIHDEFHLAKV